MEYTCDLALFLLFRRIEHVTHLLLGTSYSIVDLKSEELPQNETGLGATKCPLLLDKGTSNTADTARGPHKDFFGFC